MELPGEVRVVDDVATSFAELVVARQPRSIALSGAWLARDCYAALRKVALDWPAIDVFFGDEPCVATRDTRHVRERLARRCRRRL